MTSRDRKIAVASLLCCGILLAGMAGCTEAKSEPLEVTYYYLPG